MLLYSLPAFVGGDATSFLSGVARASQLIKKVSYSYWITDKTYLPSILHLFYLPRVMLARHSTSLIALDEIISLTLSFPSSNRKENWI